MQRNIQIIEKIRRPFNNKTTFQLFDEKHPRKNLHKDLILVEALILDNSKKEITIQTSSSLILICLPVLKKIKQLKIDLVVKRGEEPTELLGIAKILKTHKLDVRVKYSPINV